VLQRVAACCSVLQYAVNCIRRIAKLLMPSVVCCSLLHSLQHVAVCCSMLQRVAVCYELCKEDRSASDAVRNVMQCVAACCRVLQCVAACYDML